MKTKNAKEIAKIDRQLDRWDWNCWARRIASDFT